MTDKPEVATAADDSAREPEAETLFTVVDEPIVLAGCLDLDAVHAALAEAPTTSTRRAR